MAKLKSHRGSEGEPPAVTFLAPLAFDKKCLSKATKTIYMKMKGEIMQSRRRKLVVPLKHDNSQGGWGGKWKILGGF
jgi:hypothetical protein